MDCTRSPESEEVTWDRTYSPRPTTFMTMMIMMKWDWGMKLTDLAQDRDRWLILVNAVMNLQVP
jgi:hypothetical protein